MNQSSLEAFEEKQQEINFGVAMAALSIQRCAPGLVAHTIAWRVN